MNEKKVRVIDSLWTFCVAVAVVGPFALPLLWRNPRFSRKSKVAGTLVIIALTAFLMTIGTKMLTDLKNQIQLLQQSR